MPQLGPYSRQNVLAKLDGRTKEARLMAQTRAELTAHLGGNPSVTQRRLIDRAAWLSLHLAQVDARAVEARGLTEHDARTYLGWSNTLTRTLAALGLQGPAAPAPKTLQDHIAERARAA